MEAAAVHHPTLGVKTVAVAGHHLGEGDGGAGGAGGDLAATWLATGG